MLGTQASPAFAYIDPNIGGQIYQAIYPMIALLVGAIAFARQWIAAIWHTMVGRVKRLLPGATRNDRDSV